MARAGIYKSEVLRARDKLRATGRNPSIDAVREELGSGSKTTIHRYLKEIETNRELRYRFRRDSLYRHFQQNKINVDRFVEDWFTRNREPVVSRSKFTQPRAVDRIGWM